MDKKTYPALGIKMEDGTIKDVGKELVSLLALYYKQQNVTIEDIKESHRAAAPQKGTQAAEVWEYISAESERKFMELNS